MQGKIRAAGINEISAIPQTKLSPPAAAAEVVAWLAAGLGDEYAGTMVDVRDPDLQARLRA
jgi:hypothetical protein